MAASVYAVFSTSRTRREEAGETLLLKAGEPIRGAHEAVS